MIPYHGGPITPIEVARQVWTGRHAMISFAYPAQIELAAEVCQSFVVDHGAFSAWKAGNGARIDRDGYMAWLETWSRHPAFDWHLIEDVIDGDEAVNRELVESWPLPRSSSVPVWHLHESLEYLDFLVTGWPRVALGSSGEWSDPGSMSWWGRMEDAMSVVCDQNGRPRCKLHGLRMLDPAIFGRLPLSSADSCNVARNVGMDGRWSSGYLAGVSKPMRGQIIASRIESAGCASRWVADTQGKLFALGETNA